MAYAFLETLATPGVRAAQAANGSDVLSRDVDREFTRFTDAEAAFIAARDSFYLSTVSASGWPYIQHRGGPPGFLRVLDDTTLGFADLAGNRQYVTLGNVATDDRAALILVDYPRRARLKVLARLAVHDLAAEPDLAARLAMPGYRGRPERAFTLKLASFDWNCPQHITPRYSVAEVEAVLATLRGRLAVLEDENAALRAAAALRSEPMTPVREQG